MYLPLLLQRTRKKTASTQKIHSQMIPLVRLEEVAKRLAVLEQLVMIKPKPQRLQMMRRSLKPTKEVAKVVEKRPRMEAK